ncbi:MAG TPA: hypothetical protein VFR33_01410 [Candidatus Dormibacteraeota bacterium]|nr:hypothetical protein [Candidatus Dormibacteraeota bacterium]
MVLKPGLQGIVFALPGMLLSGFFLMIAVAGAATGMPVSVALPVAGIAVVLGVLWVPVIVYLAGTRLTVSADQLEMRQAFGFRVKRIRRTQIARVDRSDASVGSDGGEWPGIPVAYYDIISRGGKRWARLRTWVWSRSECESLRSELHHPDSGSATATSFTWPESRVVGASPAAPIAVPSRGPGPRTTGSVDEGFVSFLQSAGCVVQGVSMLIGFGVAALIVAAAFDVPMGRELGGYAVPGAIIGAAIGSSALLSQQIYSLMVSEAKRGPLAAKSVAAIALLGIPALLWALAFLVLSAVLNLVSRTSG